MGKSLDQILNEVGEGSMVGVTVVTNQDNGIASYASGSLVYHPPGPVSAAPGPAGPFFRQARLSTTGGTPLTYFFSDRMLDIDPPPAPGTFGHSPRQPFSANATDKLGLSISVGFGPRVAKFTLLNWGNATFSVSTEARENLLVGIGPPVGNGSSHAIYVIAFTGATNPPR